MLEWPTSFLKHKDSEESEETPENEPAEENVPEKNENSENEEEKRINIAESFISENYDKIKKFAEKIYERIGIKVDVDSDEWKNTAKESIVEALQNGDWSEALATEGTVGEKVTALCVMMTPYIEESIQTAKEALTERNGSLAEKIKGLNEIIRIANDDGELQEKIKKALAVISPDEEKDFEYMDAAAKLLEELGDRWKEEEKEKQEDGNDSKIKIIESFARLLRNEDFQAIASNRFRKWLNDNKDTGTDDRDSAKEAVEEAA